MNFLSQVLKRSTNSNGLLASNEIPGWIRCEKEKSSISFQYPSANLKNHTLEFYGFVFWVVLNPAPLLLPRFSDYGIKIEKHDDSEAFPQTSYDYHGIQLEVEGISILHVITVNELYHRGYGDIKAGEVIKATPIIKVSEFYFKPLPLPSIGVEVKEIAVKTSMFKKIGVEALYRDKDGSLQLLPLAKVG